MSSLQRELLYLAIHANHRYSTHVDLQIDASSQQVPSVPTTLNMVSTRAFSTKAAVSQQLSGTESPPGCIGQSYMPRYDHPSYKPQYAANCALLNELQEDLLPEPVNRSNFFNSLGWKLWHAKSRKLNNNSAVFSINILTNKFMTLKNLDDPTSELYAQYRVKAEASLVDSYGNLGEYSKLESTILIWITQDDLETARFWENITWKGLLTCLRILGKARCNQFGEAREPDEARREKVKLESMNGSPDDYVGRGFFDQTFLER